MQTTKRKRTAMAVRTFSQPVRSAINRRRSQPARKKRIRKGPVTLQGTAVNSFLEPRNALHFNNKNYKVILNDLYAIVLRAYVELGKQDVILDKQWKNPDTENVNSNYREMREPYYWLDIGNSQYSGQVVLSAKEKALKNIFDLHPELLKQKDKKSEPTCSMAESLQHQSLFINSILAQYAGHLLWQLWDNLGLDYHGLYLNLKSLQTSKIEIK